MSTFISEEKCVVVKDRLISLDADGRAILQWQIKSETKGKWIQDLYPSSKIETKPCIVCNFVA